MKRDGPGDYDDSVQKDGNSVPRDALIHGEFQTEAGEFGETGVHLMAAGNSVCMLSHLQWRTEELYLPS